MLQRAETPVALTGVEASRSFFAPCFAQPGGEQLWVAHVDDEARCIHLASYPPGEGGAVPVRAILHDAVRLDSAGLVLAHEQAEGDGCVPGPADKAGTRALALAADAIDVALVDHLIFEGGKVSSFRRMGLL